SPQSADEQIVRDVLLQHCPEVPAPDLVVIVVDASNLERNLYFATQVIELGYPTVMALNMMDVARENGRELDPAALSKELGIRVFPMVANTRQGVTELRNYISAFARAPSALVIGNAGCKFPPEFVEGVREIAQLLPRRQRGDSDRLNAAEAGLILTDERYPGRGGAPADREILKAVLDVRRRLETKGIDWRTVAIDARYAYVETIKKAAVRETVRLVETRSDKIDRVLTHRIWGTLVFLLVMAGMFQSIFTFANVPTRILERGVGWAGLVVGNLLGPGELRSLVVDGVIAGVGAVIVFLPQICLLFLFIGILEESGYMSRAAFLMDGIMSRVGLHGKSFIPLLSS
ncbi:MAG: ferrous iron transporter B, partial [Verrucomicrobiae bacterium]|nr:ferrous iron transporter B [Verrucomicrobiae bacterium]